MINIAIGFGAGFMTAALLTAYVAYRIIGKLTGFTREVFRNVK